MSVYKKSEILDFFLSLIRKEQYHIQRRSEDACDVIDLIIEDLESTKRSLQITSSSHIIYPSFERIHNKLRQVDHHSRDINNQKGNIRHYKNEILRFSGNWIDD